MNLNPHWTDYSYWFSGLIIIAAVLAIIRAWLSKYKEENICHKCNQSFDKLNILHSEKSSAKLCDSCFNELKLE